MVGGRIGQKWSDPGRQIIIIKTEFPEIGKPCRTIFWPTSALEEKTFVHSSEFSEEKTLISASALWHSFCNQYESMVGL